MSQLIKSPSEVSYLRHTGKKLAQIFEVVKSIITPGLSGLELDAIVLKEINRLGANAAFKGYHGFPATTCISINEEVVHGIPSKRLFESGDIVSVDIGMEYAGYFADASRTYAIGEISPSLQKLLNVTQGCLQAGINKCIEGNRLSDISSAIEQYANNYGFNVIKRFGGHGIGKKLHEKPHIFNYGAPGKGILLQENMVFALEPMITSGEGLVDICNDGWKAISRDLQPVAHFEDTVLIKNSSFEILTRQE